jgi:hypothetical protein
MGIRPTILTLKNLSVKAVISSTFDSVYLYGLPIVTWAWNKLGVDVICFQPYLASNENYSEATTLTMHALSTGNTRLTFRQFRCPPDKAATYAQVSRLFAWCLDIPDTELIVSSDVDMMVLMMPPHPLKHENGGISVYQDKIAILGTDLVPEGQYPMCYATGTKAAWRQSFEKYGSSYQECLDKIIGPIDCENIRANYWGLDQELLYKNVSPYAIEFQRARPGTGFASRRLDRDDSFLLDRLSPDIIDFHLPRPLWTDENNAILMTVLKYYWPNEDFRWWENYKEQYLKLM